MDWPWDAKDRGTKDDPKPWLTTDEAVRRRYYADKFCTFRFTVSAMGDPSTKIPTLPSLIFAVKISGFSVLPTE